LVHQRFHDGEFIDVDRYHHRVVLLIIHTFEIVVGEGDGQHSRSERHCIHLVHCSQVLFPGIVGAPTAGEPFDDSVDDFPITSPFFFPRESSLCGGYPSSTDAPVGGRPLPLGE